MIRHIEYTVETRCTTMSPCKFCNLRYKWSVTRYLIKFQIYWNGQKGVINEMKIPESLVIKVYGYCYVREFNDASLYFLFPSIIIIQHLMGLIQKPDRARIKMEVYVRYLQIW